MINKHHLLTYYNKIWLPYMLNNKLPLKEGNNGYKFHKIKMTDEYYIQVYYERLSWILAIHFYEPYKKDIDIHIWNWNWGYKFNTNDMKKTGLLDLYDYCDQDYSKTLEFLRNIKLQLVKNKSI